MPAPSIGASPRCHLRGRREAAPRGQVPRAAGTNARSATVSWLVKPGLRSAEPSPAPFGQALVSLGSRAFSALPLSASGQSNQPAAEPFNVEPERTASPGELLAAAHGSAAAAMLAQMLEASRLPVRELVVTADYVFAGPWSGVQAIELTILARVDGIDEASFRRRAREAVERCSSAFGLAGGPRVKLSARLLGSVSRPGG